MTALNDATNIRTAEVQETVEKTQNEVVTETTAVAEEPVIDVVATDDNEAVNAPLAETAVAEGATSEAPVTEAPASEILVTETAVAESPVVEATVVDAPVVDAPVVDAPVAETPVVENPSVENVVSETPAAENPVAEIPASENPVDDTPTTSNAPALQEQIEQAPSLEEEAQQTPALQENEVDAVQTQEMTCAEPEKTLEQKQAEYKEKLIAGKRFLKIQDYPKAVEAFSDVAVLATEIYGNESADIYESHYLYGKALIELSKMEDTVVENALQNIPEQAENDANNSIDEEKYGNPDTLTEEEREEIKQQVEDALDADADADEPVAGEAAEAEASEPTEKMETDDGEAGEEADEAETGEAEAEAGEADTNEGDAAGDVAVKQDEEEEEEEGEGEDEEEEVTNMQIAWEILEVAGNMCTKQLAAIPKSELESYKDWALKKSDVLCLTGEIQVLDGKVEEGIKDFLAAIELQQSVLPASSRIMAQTHHFAAKAYWQVDFHQSAHHFEEAKKILDLARDECKAQLETSESKKDLEDVIKEIDDVVKEIDALIADAHASAVQSDKVKAQLKEELSALSEVISIATDNGPADSNEKVNDISGMVRRAPKRTASNEPGETDEPSKKVKADEEPLPTN